ncbi:MAG: serine/threonine-protein kinase [Polyangiales bacterium]
MGERTGQRFGGYTVSGHIADGSMGAVYQGRHDETGERVAIKVLHPRVARDGIAAERFRREYETAKSLRHPYIIDVRDFGETDDGADFMTMELLEGEELSLILEREGGMRPARAVRIVCQLAMALHHAHTDGVVHRDLKPDNIFICARPDGDEIRVLDFGSVKLQLETGPKLTMLGTILGSPYYMSPEQAMGKLDVDPRSDVFAQTAIMYELATGDIAFAADTIPDILNKIIGEDPPPVRIANPAYPWSFEEVVRKGLQKEKSERFGSSIELAEAMLSAFGLHPDVEHWASAPLKAIETAIEDAPEPPSMASPSPPPFTSSVPPELPTRERRDTTLAIVAVLASALILGAWLLLRS